jgi:alkylation response protein AidB-like acyl-CoA dehydrogenase
MARRIDTYLTHLVPEEKFAFYEAVRDFSDTEIAPNLLHWERDHSLVPDDCIRKMGELGLFGLPIAEQYGGQGGDHTDLVLMGLALGYHSQSVAITPGAAIIARRQAAAALRHRSAEAGPPAGAGPRRTHVCVRPIRAWARQRRGQSRK